MAVILSGYVDQAKLAEESERAERKLGPEVVRVKYSVGDDTSGEPSIHFRIVLTDAASRRATLGDVITQISGILLDELRAYENWGLRTYFSFRSQSEHAGKDDPAWA